jgi:aspartate/methionine/tyrosine aminotransferase
VDAMLAERMKRIGFSPTLKISAKAKAMQADGIDVIDLSVGEPDFPTPRNIREAAKRAIDEGYTKYTPSSGMIQARQAVARKLKIENGLDYDPKTEIILSCGAKSSLAHLLMATINKDEEVIIPAPYWVSYPEMVHLAKGTPVVVETREQNGFRLTPKELKAALSASTKAIILNNPNNPTGSAYTRDQLMEICEVAADEGLIIIADEIYEKLIYDGIEFVSIASLSPAIKARAVVVNGVSKAYSMTGWRIGYAAGPAEIIGGMSRVQSHTTSNPCTISQMATIEALLGPQDEIDRMREEFVRRRNTMYARLKAIPHVSCHKAEGAFYLFPNFSHYYGYEYEGACIRNSYGLAYHLLRHGHVAVVPGDAFGAPPFIRLSYATGMERVEAALDRISDAVARLRPARKVKKRALMNTVTKVKEPVKTEAELTTEQRDSMVVEADRFLRDQPYFEWNANISGIVVQLRTNSPHLSDFFVENWYPSPLESDIEPHGIIYALNWIPGKEIKAYYNSATRTAFLYKSAYYGQIRSLALGMVSDVAERIHDLHMVRGVCLDVGGKGILLLAPPGTGKTSQMVEMLKRADCALVSQDVVFIRHQGGKAVADSPERKLYMQTKISESMPGLEPLFDRSKCENVVTAHEDCNRGDCPAADVCPLERGAPYCYFASGASRAMLDPYWIDGASKHVKRTTIDHVILLRRDPIAKAVERLDPDIAVRHVEEGRDHHGHSIPFLNPHLMLHDMEHTELQRRHFRRLFEAAAVTALNVDRVSVKDVQRSLREIAGLS